MLQRTSDRSRENRRGAQRRNSVAYRACLAAVAAMLATAVLAGPLFTSHRVVAGLHLRTTVLGGANEQPALPEAAAPAWSAAQWRQALDEAGLVPGSEDATAAYAEQRRAWARRVQVQVETTPSGDTRLRIAVDAADNVQAAALAAALSRLRAMSFRQQCHELWQRTLEQARTARQQAAQRLDETLQRWHAALQQWLEQATEVTPVAYWQTHHAAWGHNSSAGQDPGTSTASGPPGASPPASDEAAALRRDIARLQDEREQLLRTMTEAHPQVQRLDRELVQLYARLQTLEASAGNALHPAGQPLRLEPRPVHVPAAAGVPHAPEDSAASTGTSWSHQRHQLAQLIEHYQREVAAAEDEHRDAQRREQAAWHVYRQRAGEPLVWNEPLVHHTTLAGGRRAALLAVGLVLAALAAAAVVRLERRAAANFASLDEARTSLPIPVLGTMPCTADVARPAALHERLRRITIGCEACVAACLLWLVVLSAWQSDFLHTLAADPLSALAQAAPRTWRGLP